MTGDREAAVETCHQMQLFMAEGEGRQRVWQLLRADGGARLPVRTKMPGTFSAMQAFLFRCLHVGMETWHVPTWRRIGLPFLFGFGILLIENNIIPSWGPEEKVLWRGISWRQSRGVF